ncbi:MFS transporter [Listeria grayi]|uniref:MFS transporter n=1 Tax=Listeria grayi TaxID=1641 RepID=UPI001625BD02|nr:MFS transporter [Listeria grayi]MBC1921755.1 MFS transporter [Listeria grayi]
MGRWGKFLLLYAGGVVISLSQLKVPPVIPELAAKFDTSVSALSWLMSIFTVSGIFIALPGGMIVARIGAKKLLLGITACLALGNFLGAVSSNYTVMLISRAVEGISFSTIVMTGVVLISYWFKESDNSGTAIGIFTTFSAAGSLIAMNIFAPMAAQFGLQSLWIFTGCLSLLLFFCFALFLDAPSSKAEGSAGEQGLFRIAAKNKKIWLLAVMQGCMAFVLFTFINIYPLLFTDYYGLSKTVANFYASLFGLFGIPFGVLAGYLIDKTKKPGLIISTAFLLMVCACLGSAYLSASTYILQIFCLSVAASLSSSAVTIMVPHIAKHSKMIGYSMSLVNLLYYLGIFIGAPIITKMIEKTSWRFGIFLLAGVAAIGFTAALFFWLTSTRTLSLQEEELS